MPSIANPTGRVECLNTSNDIAAAYNSFGFALIQASPKLADENLHFAPFSTPRSIARIGFFYNKKARPGVRTLYQRMASIFVSQA